MVLPTLDDRMHRRMADLHRTNDPPATGAAVDALATVAPRHAPLVAPFEAMTLAPA
jgi:hypothetical protein